jgi:hypothetical protein
MVEIYNYANYEIKEIDGLGEPAGPNFADLVAALRSGEVDK